jgi:hypothetical protein
MLAFGPLWSPNAPLKNLLLNDWPFSQKPSAINEPLIEGVVNCYDPKLITEPKTFHIQDIARLLNVGEALFDLALIAVFLAV